MPPPPPPQPSPLHSAGAHLLTKIHRQPLPTFLSAHLWHASGKRHHNLLSIPALDPLINAVLNPVLANPTNLPTRLRLPVIEITSRGSLGKTHLLYLIAAIATLPKSVGGKEAAAVVIDCTGTFSAMRLASVMRGYIPSHPRGGDLTPILRTALQHVHIFRPCTSSELLSTLTTLPSYLFTLHPDSDSSRSRRVDCILLDSLSRFIFTDRHSAYTSILLEPSDTDTDYLDPDLSAHYTCILGALKDAAGKLCAYIVATSTSFHERDREATGWRPGKVTEWHRYYEPWRLKLPVRPVESFGRPWGRGVVPGWAGMVNVRIVLGREKAAAAAGRFGGEVGVEEALRRRGERVVAVRQTGVMGWVDARGLGGGVQKKVEEANDGRGAFRLVITADGVNVTV